MRLGIFADVHANLDAFDEVVKEYKKFLIDKYIFLGDIVGYCANPCECINLLQTLDPICIAGNHDWATAEIFGTDFFNPDAKEALFWTQEQLSKENIEYLRNFRLVYNDENFVCVHGSMACPGGFQYIWDNQDACECFKLFDKPVCFVAHSHIAENYSYSLESDKLDEYIIEHNKNTQIKIEVNRSYIINVGSVGQPRDRDPRASFAVYDTDKNEISLKRVEYNIKKTAGKIIQAGLPNKIATRLFEGK